MPRVVNIRSMEARLPRALMAAVTLTCHVSVTVVPSFAWAGERRDAQDEGADSAAPGRALTEGANAQSTLLTMAEVLAQAEQRAGGQREDKAGSGDGSTAVVIGADDDEPRGQDDQNGEAEESGAEQENAGAAPTKKDLKETVAPQALAASVGSDKSGVTSQAISIPKGAGSIQGMEESFSAQLSAGIATFAVPFALPKARGGVAPSLGLSYSSAGGAGPAGQGWSVGVPFIARQTDRGLPKYKDGCNASTAPGFACRHPHAWHPEQDRFVFNGGQELVPICTVMDGACEGALSAELSGVDGLADESAVEGTDEVMPDWAEGYQYFRPRVEGAFLRFFWAPDGRSWIVQDKSGATLELGAPSGGPAPGGLKLAGDRALERNPTRASEIYRWHLSRQYDQHIQAGVPLNLVVYDYVQDGDQAYLTDIYDTTPAATPTTTDVSALAHHTRLRWEARPDITESYRAGWLMRAGLRLAGVDVAAKSFLHGPSAARGQVRRYHLSYSADFHRSLLTSVQVEGRCGGSEDAAETPREQAGRLPNSTRCGLLPPMTFDYSQVEGYEPSGKKTSARLSGYMPFDGRVQVLQGSPDHSIDEALTDFFDIDSDGLPDVLVTAPGMYGNGHAVFFNGDRGQARFSKPVSMGMQGVLGADSNTLKLSNLNVSPQDVDGDGRVNLLHMPRAQKYAIYDARLVGNQWTWAGRAVQTASGQNVKIDFGNDTLDTQLADVDFDGLIDVIVSTGTEYQTFFSLGRYPGGDGQFGWARWTGARSANINNNPVTTCVPHSSLPVRFSDADVKWADMNGDGILDIVRVRRGDIQYWPGRGNGYFGTGERDRCPGGQFEPDRYKEMTGAPHYSDVQGSTLRLDDVNGDGLADLVQVRFDAVDIWLNVDGRGWTERFILDGTPHHAAFNQRVRLTDVNGSGTPDIVWGDAKSYKYIDLEGGKKAYLLVGVRNGLGKSTALEYSTSTHEMLTAEASGNACEQAPASDRFAAAWCSKMPTVAHVVKRVIERDNITIRGRPPAEYVTEYEYRDPVYEGRQREFRGFARARARRIGDANSPTDVSESVFLLGECLDPSDGTAWDGVDQNHFCAPPNRWADNAYEALKGLPVETHKMDARGVHLASTENEYTLRTLYQGLDGRAVRHAFSSTTDTLLYDTGLGDPGRAGIVRRGFVDEDHGSSWAALSPDTSSEDEQYQAKLASLAHLRSVSVVDVYGNRVQATNEGCVAGGQCPQHHGLAADEAISQITVPVLLDTSDGWMWRTVESYTVGSGHGEVRGYTFTSFDGLGRPNRSQAELQGIDEAGALARGMGAGTPGGAATEGLFTQSATAYDAWGNAVRTRGRNGRCAEVSYGDDFALFATTESIQTSGNVQDDDAGVEAIGTACVPDLSTSASYDHGLGVVTLASDLNGRDTKADYDQFGRVVALYKPSATKTNVSPSHQDVPNVQIQYYLPTDLGGTAHSIIHTRTQDGQDETDSAQWLESYAYVDGFGRTLVTLSEADPSQGTGAGNDGGQWIAGSLLEWDAKSAVAKKYMPFFWTGSPLGFNYGVRPATQYGRQRYDAFGRQVQTYDLDGMVTLQSRYHALSTDLWDAADLTPGQHQHSYATERKDGHGRTVQITERFRDHGVMEQRHVRTTYLPTGEPESISRVRAGSSPIVRWMRYDSLGRMLLNVEPNTTVGYTSSPAADASNIQAWRYQYNHSGDLIATSDARGCGQNFYYDGAGRILGEDYAPCEPHHEAYSAPTGGSYGAKARDAENLEVTYYYDNPNTLPSGIAPGGWTGSTVGGSFTLGRAIAVLDRGSASFTTFDGRGRTVQSQTRIAKPTIYASGAPQHRILSDRYAPRVYERSLGYDAADREVRASTGAAELKTSTGAAKVPSYLNPNGESEVLTKYSARGAVKAADSSYGSLVSNIVRTADNLVTSITYGDAASTTTAYLYDERRRISSVQTYRGPPASGYWTLNDTSNSNEPTQQMVLQDEDFIYDVVGNPVEIRDWRDAVDWPVGAKPVTKKIEYDDLYRATRIRYDYVTGDDVWKSPFDADLGSEPSTDEGPRRAKPSPHVSFEKRILEQKFEYDWVGNSDRTTDDANGFYDRSLGAITNDTQNDKPYQLRNASLGGARGGQLEARYDAAGHMTRMALQRSGPCLGGASGDCNQQFVYDWDEVGRLARARRWDGNTDSVDTFNPSTAGTPVADLRHVYDASDQRVIKEAVDEEDEHSFTLYVFSSLELRRAQYGTSFADTGNPGDSDFEVNHWTVTPYLMANGVRLARLVYHGEDVVPEDGVASGGMPGDVNASTSQLHVFFELGDHLGSTSVVLDKATGELVERATFQAYGGAESDYRPGRWANFREDYRFTGKEEDVEVGLQYFGFRYLNPLLGRWISPDPLEVHTPGGSGELNVYSYVSGAVLKNVDPLGLCDGNQSCEAIQSNSDGSTGNSDGSVDNSSNVVTIPEITIVGQLDAQDSDPSPGAEGASGVDDGKTGSSGGTTECVGMACKALTVTAEAIGSLAKSATPLAPTGDSPCRTATDCQQRSDQADAGLVAGPASAGAAKLLRSASASRAAGRVAGAITAEQANAPHVAAGRHPPYAPGTGVRDIVLTRERNFVRVHGEGNQARSWLVRAEEIDGLSPAQIRDKLALPETPTMISDVRVPAGTHLRVGTVGKQEGWGNGGGVQYELLDRIPSDSFSNARSLTQ